MYSLDLIDQGYKFSTPHKGQVCIEKLIPGEKILAIMIDSYGTMVILPEYAVTIYDIKLIEQPGNSFDIKVSGGYVISYYKPEISIDKKRRIRSPYIICLYDQERISKVIGVKLVRDEKEFIFYETSSSKYVSTIYYNIKININKLWSDIFYSKTSIGLYIILNDRDLLRIN